jgi:hypothetical protein
VVVGPRKVAYAAVDGVVVVAGPLGSEFEDAPFLVVSVVEEGYEAREGVSVSQGRVCDGGPGCY